MVSALLWGQADSGEPGKDLSCLGEQCGSQGHSEPLSVSSAASQISRKISQFKETS